MDFKAAKPSSPTPSAGSYYIVPPDGGEPVRYQRVSGFIKVFADNSNLVKRDIRYAVKGSAKYAEQIAQLDIDENRYDLDTLAERAAREAGKWWSADYGTAVHALTEDFDNGLLQPDFTRIPDTPAVSDLERGPMAMLSDKLEHMRNDLQGYANLVEAYQIETVHAEATMVIDDYKVAGTADRFVRIGNPMDLPVDHDADCAVLDLKTGSVDFGRREKALQLAAYSKAQLYNHDNGERTDHGGSLKYGYILHLPAGAGRGDIIPVPLERPLEELEVAHQNWKIRNRKNVWKKYSIGAWLQEEIRSAPTEDDLTALYNRTKSYWGTDEVTLAKAQVNKIKEG